MADFAVDYKNYYSNFCLSSLDTVYSMVIDGGNSVGLYFLAETVADCMNFAHKSLDLSCLYVIFVGVLAVDDHYGIDYYRCITSFNRLN